MRVNFIKSSQAAKLIEPKAKSNRSDKHTAQSLRGFLQHHGEPVPIEKLCQPVEYSTTFERSE